MEIVKGETEQKEVTENGLDLTLSDNYKDVTQSISVVLSATNIISQMGLLNKETGELVNEKLVKLIHNI